MPQGSIEVFPQTENMAAAEDTPKGGASTYQPTPKEEKAIKQAMKLFRRSKANRMNYDEHWLKWYKMHRGIQWEHQRPSYRHSEVINMVFQAIQSTVPIMMDSRPRVEYLPQGKEDQKFAELLNQLFNYDWERNNWRMEVLEAVYDANFFGTGFAELGFDEDAMHGVGEISLGSYDPFWLFPDPSARDINKDCEYIVTAKPEDVGRVRRRYPKHRKWIHADMHDIMHGSREDLGQIRYKSPVDNRTVLEGSSAQETAHKDQVLVITAYMKPKDIDEEKVKESDEETGEESTKFVQKLRYPKGRKIVVANGVLLEDEKELPYSDDKFPFARLVNYVLPREFFGISEVEQLESPQKMFNKVYSFSLDVLTLMANPVWVIDSESGVEPRSMTNRPGLIIEKMQGSEVRRESGVPVGSDVFAMLDRLKQWFDQEAGAQDITRGVPSQGVTAASAIEQLQQAAQTRIRQKMRNLDAFMTDIGRLYMARAMEFYKTPRVVRITGDEEASEFFAVQFSERDGKTIATISKRTELEEGNFVDQPVKELILQGELDIRATTGTGLPFAKREKRENLLQLFDRGIIDEQEVLKNIDHPNYEAVLARVEEKQAAEAEAAAQAAPQQ